MSGADAFLAELHARASAAAAEETAWRQQAAKRTRTLEQARAHAFRRWNVLRDLSAVMAGEPEDPEAAVVLGLAQLRQRLGWPGTPDPFRQDVLEALRPVALALLGEGAPDGAIEAFEAWFEARTGNSFWALLDQPIADMPVVDF